MKIYFFDHQNTEQSQALWKVLAQIATKHGHDVVDCYTPAVDYVVFDANNIDKNAVAEFRSPESITSIIGLVNHGTVCPLVDIAIEYNTPEACNFLSKLEEQSA